MKQLEFGAVGAMRGWSEKQLERARSERCAFEAIRNGSKF